MKVRMLFMSLVAMLLAACSEAPVQNNAISFDEVMTSRRSIRNYDASKTISQAEVRELLLAVQDAPSWANVQSTRYYVAMSEEKVAAVQELIGDSNKKNVQGAPVLIVSTFKIGQSGCFRGVAVNEIGDGWGAYDNGLSNGYLILKARAMGFDTLIMGMRDGEALRALFNIPADETVMAVISLGYRASDPNRPARHELDEMVKFY